MIRTEESFSKLKKEDLIRLTLDFQHKHDNLLGKLVEDFAGVKANYVKLETDLSITLTVSDTFKNPRKSSKLPSNKSVGEMSSTQYVNVQRYLVFQTKHQISSWRTR